MQIDERPKHVPEEETRPPLLSVPAATAVLLAGTLVVLGGIFLVGRALRPAEPAPVTAVSSTGTATAAQPTAAAQATSAQTPVSLATVAPTTTPTPAPTAAPVTALAVPAATTAAAGQLTTWPSLIATAEAGGAAPRAVNIDGPCRALETAPAERAAEVANAYLRYFDVSGQALLQLNPQLLDEVTAGEELKALIKNINDDRAAGRALKTDVVHDCVVLSVSGDLAEIYDRYRDSSIYVDPATQQPLPGEKIPASPDVAPEVTVIYQLQRFDETWKVVDGEKVT